MTENEAEQEDGRGPVMSHVSEIRDPPDDRGIDPHNGEAGSSTPSTLAEPERLRSAEVFDKVGGINYTFPKEESAQVAVKPSDSESPTSHPSDQVGVGVGSSQNSNGVKTEELPITWLPATPKIRAGPSRATSVACIPGRLGSLKNIMPTNNTRSAAPPTNGSANGPPPKRNFPEEWESAKQQKDCKTLIALMKEEGFHIKKCELISGDRTALHIAAMQGCFPLVKRILDVLLVLKQANAANYAAEPTSIEDVINRMNLLLLRHGKHDFPEGVSFVDYVARKDEQSNLSAFEMANDIIGNRSISRYISHVLNSEEEIDPVFCEAYPLTMWYRGLLERDSDVSELFSVNSRLLLEKMHGMTVLHMAILKNDLELVKKILELFGSEKKIEWGESYYPHSLTLQQMLKPYPSIRLNDQFWKDERKLGTDHVDTILRNAVLWQGDAIAMARALGPSHDPIVEELEKASNEGGENPSNQQSGSTTHPPKLLPEDHFEALAEEFFADWKEEWNVDYNADVDFNFENESRRVVLRLHHACKDPSKFNNFLQVFGRAWTSPLELLLFYQIQDAQGRTPINILLHQYKIDHDSKLQSIIDLILEHRGFLPMNEDGRGRRLFELSLMNKYIPYNILIQLEYFEYMDFTIVNLQMALLSQQPYFIERILEKFRNNPKLDLKIICNWRNNLPSPLIIAAATGNHKSLSLLLEYGFDPMIVDNEGRSTLHHAADATLLKYPQSVLRHCCSTLDIFCNIKKEILENQSMDETSHVTIEGNTSKENQSLGETSHVSVEGNTSKEKEMKEVERLNVERKACILMLLQNGVDLSQPDNHKKVPNIGPTNDANYQSWWYDLVVKDTTDKKKSFNDAGNALSVVGTLVAATSYVGPLQPPMSYTNGFANISEKLVKIFMWSNTLAFYLAVASVMIAVVPSLPMPQESVMSELNRARHMVSFCLCLLLAAIGLIIISFAAATMAVTEDGHSFGQTGFLFAPSIIGWFFCFIAIIGFLIRLMRLVFYSNRIVRNMYKFSFTNGCMQIFSWITGFLLCKYSKPEVPE